jgi:Cdc6-like AAA superfamily ATPase
MEEEYSIIQGPPGTGKTQTIMNIALNVASKGEKVLIASEKFVALDVLYQRLIGLDKRFQSYILNLSLKIDKRKFYRQFIGLKELLRGPYREEGELTHPNHELLIQTYDGIIHSNDVLSNMKKANAVAEAAGYHKIVPITKKGFKIKPVKVKKLKEGK